jgi:hypothetical protein
LNHAVKVNLDSRFRGNDGLVQRSLKADCCLHPLAQRNISTLQKQRFAGTFSGDESFMIRYRQAQRQFIPALFYLEMARFAAEQLTGRTVTGLKNMVWSTPLAYRNGSAHEAVVSLHEKDAGILYSIDVEGPSSTLAHLGEVVVDGAGLMPSSIDLARIRARLKPIDSDGLDLSGAHVNSGAAEIAEVFSGGNELLAVLCLPDSVDAETRGMMFQPLFINAAWQLIQFISRSREAMWLPFSLRSIEAAGPLPDQVVAHLVRKASSAGRRQKYDLTLYDLNGKACLCMRDLAVAAQDGLVQLQKIVTT